MSRRRSNDAIPVIPVAAHTVAPPRRPTLPYHGALWTVALSAACLATGCQWTTAGKNSQGVHLFQQGQYQQAAQVFEKAIYQSPSDADGYYNLAATYHQLGKANRSQQLLDNAETLYLKCLDYNENHTDCYRGLSVLLVEKNQPEKAQRLLEGWFNRNPGNPAAKVELARLHEEFGDRQGAKEYLQQALAVDPYETRALAALGRLQESEGNAEQALANYQRSLYRNQLQPEVAARVASLRAAVNAGMQTSPGTRTVTTPVNPTR